MKTVVLFDLEETLVNNWDDFLVVNQHSVNNFLSTLPKNCLYGLFSWAVWNQTDLVRLVNEEQEYLENNFDFKFDENLLFTTEDHVDMVKESDPSLDFTFKDFFNLYNKETAMLALMKLPFFNNTHLYLVDDTVENLEFFSKENNCKLSLVKVQTL